VSDPVVEIEANFRLGLAGNELAYHRALAALTGHLRGFFRARLSSAHEHAEDLVQETLIAVHTQRHTFDPTAMFAPWLYAIARYKLIDCYRRRGSRGREQTIDDASALFATRNDTAVEARCDVQAMLARLPPRHRGPIELVKLQGLSVAEAAARLGMGESAVKVGIHRGLKTLARDFGDIA